MLTPAVTAAICLFAIPCLNGATTGPLKYTLFPQRNQSCEVEVKPQPVGDLCRVNAAEFRSVLHLNVRNTGAVDITPPYSFSLQNIEYEAATDPFNVDLGSSRAVDGWISGTASQPWLKLGANASSTASFGLTVQAASNDTTPTRIKINDTPCTLLIQSGSDSSDKVASQYMTTRDGEVMGADGTAIDFKGIAWFGFDDGNTMLDGLWPPDGAVNAPDGLRMELTTVLQRLQLLGFNALRLPFSFTDLFTTAPRNFTKNCTHPTDAEILNSVTPPEFSLLVDNATLPDAQQALIGLPAGLHSPPGWCNTYLPGSSTLERFVWVVRYLTQQGFYVVLVNQFNFDFIFGQSPTQWLQSWQWLMAALQNGAPDALPRLIIDPVNEPEIQSVMWEDNAATGKPGLATLYLEVMDLLYSMDPNLLYFVQGTGQSRASLVSSSGDGFVVDPALLAAAPNASDPNPFFRALLSKPYLQQVVVSPHLYPPSVAGGTGADIWKHYSAQTLWTRFSNSFGHFNTGPGYCDALSDRCHKFPVVVGELGSKFESMADIDVMYDIAEYMHNVGDGEDGRHSRIGSWFFWAYNANSGDTGGIVDDNWESILWDKIEYLQYLGLRPWYMSPQLEAAVEVGLNGTFTDGVEADPPRPDFKLVAPPACDDRAPDTIYTCKQQKEFGKCEAGFITTGNFCKATCGHCPENSTLTTGLTPSSEGATVPAPAPAELRALTPIAQDALPVLGTRQGAGGEVPRSQTPAAGCSVEVQVGLPWASGTDQLVPLGLRLALKSGRLEPPWQLLVANAHYSGVAQAYNLQVQSAAAGIVSGLVLDSSLALDAAAGSSATLTMILRVSSTTALLPEEVILNNGLTCQILQPVCTLAPSPAEATAPSMFQVSNASTVG